MTHIGQQPMPENSKPKRRKPRGPTAAELCDPRPMEFFLKTIRDTGVPADFQARVMWIDPVSGDGREEEITLATLRALKTADGDE